LRKVKNSFFNNNNSDSLFDGDDAMFKRTISKSSIYAEYGCGASTIWVAKNVGCEILSVDSSSEWISKVKNECAAYSKITLHLADVGEVGAWGFPVGYMKADNFSEYSDWIWTNNQKPNVILIDGRFRVCCFLTCVLNSEIGTKIIFDDYTNRPQYHYIENYVKPIETCGKQALFIVPKICEIININSLKDSINKFRFVFD
jgi:hypothetical protein